MDTKKDTKIYSRLLLDWYYAERRILPWREDPTPYHVWISEIMLQQTRVEAVKEYYRRFLEALPDVRALAEAEESEYMKLWEGLGYYSRVRNMHKAAVVIMEEHGGQIPGTSQELEKLPGIGSYTAAAIASIAFGEPVPSVDGNLLRVFARMTCSGQNILDGSTKKLAEAWYQERISREAPGDFNQAVMDLGATVCLPNTAPLCLLCPWAELCESHAAGRELEFPVRIKKTKKKVEKMTVFLIGDGQRIVLHRRPETGLLAGLYEFPNAPGHLAEQEARERLMAYGLRIAGMKKLPAAKHLFSHVTWQMEGYQVEVAPEDLAGAEIRAGAQKDAVFSAEQVSCSGEQNHDESGRSSIKGNTQNSRFSGDADRWIAVAREELENNYTVPAAFDVYRKLVKP